MEIKDQENNQSQSEQQKDKKENTNEASGAQRVNHTDPDEATDRKNQGSKEKERKSGSAEDKAEFENPDDDPA